MLTRLLFAFTEKRRPLIFVPLVRIPGLFDEGLVSQLPILLFISLKLLTPNKVTVKLKVFD